MSDQNKPTIWDSIKGLGGAYGAGWAASELIDHASKKALKAAKAIPKAAKHGIRTHPYIAYPAAGYEFLNQLNNYAQTKLTPEQIEEHNRRKMLHDYYMRQKQLQRYGPLSQYHNPNT